MIKRDHGHFVRYCEMLLKDGHHIRSDKIHTKEIYFVRSHKMNGYVARFFKIRAGWAAFVLLCAIFCI